ncbi:MAG: zinc ribbon domain-containing protein, partial [Gemmatimonadaceae bacterium]
EPPPAAAPAPAPRASAGAERAGAESAFPDPSAFGFPLRAPTPGPTPRASTGSTQTIASAASPTPPGTAPGILAQGSCRYCGGTLPDGRRITYCPHCGQNLTVRQCPACSTELELGWRFCVTCGRQVT